MGVYRGVYKGVYHLERRVSVTNRRRHAMARERRARACVNRVRSES